MPHILAPLLTLAVPLSLLSAQDPRMPHQEKAAADPYLCLEDVTGDKAVVTNWFSKDPCRPEVRLIGGLDKMPTDQTVGVTIDLRDAPRTQIAFAEGQHVLDDNYTLDEGDLSQAA